MDFPAEDPIEVIKHLMIGSEGTLGFVSRATYNTVPEWPNKARARARGGREGGGRAPAAAAPPSSCRLHPRRGCLGRPPPAARAPTAARRGFASGSAARPPAPAPHPKRAQASAFIVFPDVRAACRAASILRDETAVDAVELFDRWGGAEGRRAGGRLDCLLRLGGLRLRCRLRLGALRFRPRLAAPPKLLGGGHGRAGLAGGGGGGRGSPPSPPSIGSNTSLAGRPAIHSAGFTQTQRVHRS